MEKMKKDIKIFVSHRIDLDSETIANPLFIPVRCGAVYDKRENVTMLGDDTGDNISEKRNSFCELTVQYWAWKNVNADYYGLCHYRRYLSFSNSLNKTEYLYDKETGLVCHNEVIEKYLDKETENKYKLLDESFIRNVVEQYDILTNEWSDVTKMMHPKGYCKSVEEYWLKLENIVFPKNTIKITREIIKKYYPEMLNSFDEYLGGKNYLGYNCFVMKKEIFNKYNNFIFTILFELEKNLDGIEYFNKTLIRSCAFVSEILYGVYIYHLQKTKSIKSLQLIFFKNTQKKKEIEKVFKINDIPIVLLSSNYYVPYLGVFLKSLIQKSHSSKNYDIIILEKEIEDKNKKELKKIIYGYKNFSVRFYNVKHLIKNVNFYVSSTAYAEEAYYRLLTPWILEKYDKAIVMDCDIIVNQDISILFDEDIEDYLAAGVKDIVWQGLVNNFNSDTKEYTEKVMGLKNPYNYINTGVLLMNLKKFREKFILEEFIKFAQSKKLRVQEQDLLNIILENKVKFIDLKYNFYVETNPWVTEQLTLAPYSGFNEYNCTKNNPVLIHYANLPKPWSNPEIEFASNFWEVARETAFYEVIISRLCAEHANSATYWHQQNFHAKFLNQVHKQKIKNFIKIFFPTGTKRYAALKRLYFKLRGWSVN